MSVRIHLLAPTFAVTSAFLLLLVSCATDPTPPPDTDVATVEISPQGLILPVGGQGQLGAVVRDAGGGTVSMTVTWSSRNPGVASVADGTVDGNAVGTAEVVATAGSHADTVVVLVIDNFTLEVTPPVATVEIGESVGFTAIARDGGGNSIPLPPITWASSDPPKAPIDGDGVATGANEGSTNITASSRTVTSPPAVLHVTDPNISPACDGITGIAAFEGEVNYTFKVLATDNGGFDISANDAGQLKATMTRQSTGPFIASWWGDISGTASIVQSKRSGDDETTLTGNGAIVPDPVQGQPQMQLHVDLQTCSYRLIVGSVISTRFVDFDGSASTSNRIVAMAQFAGPLGAWRQLGIVDLDEDKEAHSLVWSAYNQHKDGILPLGFTGDLFEQVFDEPPVGQATGWYSVLIK